MRDTEWLSRLNQIKLELIERFFRLSGMPAFVRLIKKPEKKSTDEAAGSDDPVKDDDGGVEQVPDSANEVVCSGPPEPATEIEATVAELSECVQPGNESEEREDQRPLKDLDPELTFDRVCRSPTPRCLFCTENVFDSWPAVNSHVVVKHVATEMGSGIEKLLKELRLKPTPDPYLFPPPELLTDCRFCRRPIEPVEADDTVRESVPSFILDHDYLRTSP